MDDLHKVIQDRKADNSQDKLISNMNILINTEPRYQRLIPVVKGICRLLETKEKVLIGIDGKSASGKTTAGELLRKVTGGNLIHADDFFLPMDMRTKKRLEEPGGNIHYERLKEEVIDSINNHQELAYRVYDCSCQSYTKTVKLEPNRITIIEGAYSLHPYFGEVYDLKVFFDITGSEQEENILNRNGAEVLQMFRNKWIPMENQYFTYYNIKEKCDIVVDWQEIVRKEAVLKA